MAGVKRLKHINGLRRPYFAHDDPVGPHPKRRLDQVPDRHLAGALYIGVPGLQADQIRNPSDLQFRIVFDGNDSFISGNIL